MSKKAKTFVALFGIFAFAAILPPLLCLAPPREPKSAVIGWAPSSGPTDQAFLIVAGPCSPAGTITLYAHNDDVLVIGCACDRCQRFVVRRNP